MRWQWRSALLGLVALSLTGACAARSTEVGGIVLVEGSTRRPMEPEEVAQAGAASVAVVTTNNSRGLAFVVDPAGYLITSRHVIEDSSHVESISFPGLDPPQTFTAIKVVYIDPQRDLALLHVDAEQPLASLALGTDSAAPVETYLQVADRVLLLARDQGVEETFIAHTGSVNDLQVFNPELGRGAFVGLSNDVREGQSGGPVLDHFGRAVGVVTWTWRHRVGGYAIPIDEATRMLLERPRMELASEQRARASARATKFVDAVYAGHMDQARRMLSPTYARAIRSQTIDAIAERVSNGGGEAVSFFFAALEELVAGLDEGRESQQLEEFRELVLRTGGDEFRQMLGISGSVDSGLVVSFFFELGKAYMSARHHGEQGPDEAIETAMGRLGTLDAARTFAFATLSHSLGEGPVQITRVEVIPGVYAPKAVITLSTPSHSGLVMQMRMEWGDWYVAQVHTRAGN